MISHNEGGAPLYLLSKDHKPCGPDGLPKTRPVCGSRAGLDYQVQNLLSDVLEPVALQMKDKINAISTEDFISKCESLNRVLKVIHAKGEPENILHNLGLIGADAEALFPSMMRKPTEAEVWEAAMETDIRWEGISWHEAAKYLAISCTPAELLEMGVSRWVPFRPTNMGQKPGITAEEVLGAEVEVEKQWIFRTKSYPAPIKKRLMAGVLKVGGRAVYGHHVYSFGGEDYVQIDGGPIGNRLTMCLSEIRMMMWSRRLMKILEKLGMRVLLSICYVDDLRYVVKLLELGWILDKGTWSLKYDPEVAEKEEAEGVSRSRKTAMIIREVMNNLTPDLSFTVELPEEFEDNKLPTLDLNLWISRKGPGEEEEVAQYIPAELAPAGEEGCPQLRYSFFEKSMANKRVTMANSAMDWSSQHSILAQEVIRRLETTSLQLPHMVRKEKLDIFTRKLLRSLYTPEQARTILVSGLRGWMNKMQRAKQEKRPYHRPASTTSRIRRLRKLLDKTRWFKEERKDPLPSGGGGGRKGDGAEGSQGGGAPPQTVLFTRRTPGGRLVRALRAVETKMREVTPFRVKHVERSGRWLKDLLTKSDPWASEACGRTKCHSCMQDAKGGNCFRKSLVYCTTCTLCLKEGKTTQYIGESGRSLQERYAEHVADATKKAPTSHMETHRAEHHPHVEDASSIFKVKVISHENSSLVRQVKEAVLIQEHGQNMLLNDKYEYNRCLLPKLQVQFGSKPVEEPHQTPEGGDETHLYTMKRKRDPPSASNEGDSWERSPGNKGTPLTPLTTPRINKETRCPRRVIGRDQGALTRQVNRLRIKLKLKKFRYVPSREIYITQKFHYDTKFPVMLCLKKEQLSSGLSTNSVDSCKTSMTTSSDQVLDSQESSRSLCSNPDDSCKISLSQSNNKLDSRETCPSPSLDVTDSYESSPGSCPNPDDSQIICPSSSIDKTDKTGNPELDVRPGEVCGAGAGDGAHDGGVEDGGGEDGDQAEEGADQVRDQHQQDTRKQFDTYDDDPQPLDDDNRGEKSKNVFTYMMGRGRVRNIFNKSRDGTKSIGAGKVKRKQIGARKVTKVREKVRGNLSNKIEKVPDEDLRSNNTYSDVRGGLMFGTGFSSSNSNQQSKT